MRLVDAQGGYASRFKLLMKVLRLVEGHNVSGSPQTLLRDGEQGKSRSAR